VVAYTRSPSAFRHLGSRRSGQSQGSTFLAFLGRDPSLISRVGLYQVPLVVFKLFGPPIATPKVAISMLLHPRSRVCALFQRHLETSYLRSNCSKCHRALHVSDGVLSRRVRSSCLWFFSMACVSVPDSRCFAELVACLTRRIFTCGLVLTACLAKVSCDSCACGRVSWSSSFRCSSWYSASHLPSQSVRSDLPVAGIRLLGLLRLKLVRPLLLFLLVLIVVFAFRGFVLLVLVLSGSRSRSRPRSLLR
jgi:hypothetical protein